MNETVLLIIIGAIAGIIGAVLNKSIKKKAEQKKEQKREQQEEIVIDSVGRQSRDKTIEPYFKLTVAIAGVSHGEERRNELLKLNKGDKLILWVEFDNPYDLYAVKVISPNSGTHVGYVPKEHARKVREPILNGEDVYCEIVHVKKAHDNPFYLDTKIDIYITNHNNLNYFELYP